MFSIKHGRNSKLDFKRSSKQVLQGLAFLVISPCLPVTCWVNIYKGTGMVTTAGVIMGLVAPAGFVSPI